MLTWCIWGDTQKFVINFMQIPWLAMEACVGIQVNPSPQSLTGLQCFDAVGWAAGRASAV